MRAQKPTELNGQPRETTKDAISHPKWEKQDDWSQWAVLKKALSGPLLPTPHPPAEESPTQCPLQSIGWSPTGRPSRPSFCPHHEGARGSAITRPNAPVLHWPMMPRADGAPSHSPSPALAAA